MEVSGSTHQAPAWSRCRGHRQGSRCVATWLECALHASRGSDNNGCSVFRVLDTLTSYLFSRRSNLPVAKPRFDNVWSPGYLGRNACSPLMQRAKIHQIAHSDHLCDLPGSGGCISIWGKQKAQRRDAGVVSSCSLHRATGEHSSFSAILVNVGSRHVYPVEVPLSSCWRLP